MLGDIKQKNENNWICFSCSENLYSLNVNEMCRTCSTEPFVNCTYGGHNLFPKDGY